MSKRAVPEVDVTKAAQIKQIEFRSWRPVELGKGPPTEVQLVFRMTDQEDAPLILRVMSVNDINQIIKNLTLQRDQIWPGN